MRARMLTKAVVIAVALCGAGAANAAACSISFDNSSGDLSWHTATNWSTDQVPTSGDDVCLPVTGNAVTHTVGDTVIRSIDGARPLTIANSSLKVTGAGGPSEYRGVITLNTGSILATEGSLTLRVGGRIATNLGGELRNTGTLRLQDGADLDASGANPGSFRNSGSVIKDSLQQSDITATTLNEGIIDVNDGIARLGPGWAGADIGSYFIAGSAELRLAGSRVLGSGTLVVGAVGSTLTHESGTVVANGNVEATTVSALTGADLALRGSLSIGRLDVGGFGIARIDTSTTIPRIDVSVSASLQGSAVVTTPDLRLSGSLAGSGRLVIPSGGAGTVTGGRVLNELRNEGTLTFATGATTQVFGLLTNAAAILLRDDSDISQFGTIRNLAGGTFTKSTGVGESTINPTLDNDGTVSVQQGTLQLAGGLPPAATHDGAFTTASGAVLALGGNVEMSPAASITAPLGTLLLGPANAAQSAGTIRAAVDVRALECTSSTNDGVSFAGVTSVTGTLRITNCTVAVDDDIATPRLQLQNAGRLAGSALASFDEITVASSATMSGGGRTVLNAGGSGVISTPASLALGRRFDIAGTLDAFGDGSRMNLIDGGELRVTAGGLLALHGDGDIFGSQAPRIVRVLSGGTLRKADGSGTSDIAPTFDNDGTVEIAAGKLSLSAQSVVSDDGQYGVPAGSMLELIGTGRQLAASGSILGAGTLRAGGGTTSFDGPVNVSRVESGSGELVFNGATDVGTVAMTGGTLTFNDPVEPGAITLSDGIIAGSAIIQVPALTATGGTIRAADLWITGTAEVAAGQLTLSGAGVRNDGTVTVRGTGVLAVQQESSLDNAGELLLRDDADITGGGVASQIVNDGLISKPAGAGVSVIGVPLRNRGTATIDVQDGTLRTTTLTSANIAARRLNEGRYVLRGVLDVPGLAVDFLGTGSDVTLQGPAGRLGDGAANALAPLDVVEAAATLRLTEGADLTTTGPLSIAGLTSLGAGSDLTATAAAVTLNGGKLEGTGSVAPALSNPSGEVDPGSGGVGTLSVLGTYTQGEGGRLRAHVDAGAVVPSDLLTVTGATTLGGTLAVTTLGAIPNPGAEFTFLDYASRTGTFATVTGALLGGARRYVPQYATDHSSLVVTDSDIPAASVSDVAAAAEGSPVVVELALSLTPDTPVTLDVSTFDVTAKSPDDFTARSATPVTFAAGQRTATVSVATAHDTLDEDPETFLVQLSNVTNNATIADAEATVTITDDDASPVVSVADATITEGDAPGTKTLDMQVKLSSVSGRTVTVRADTTGGSASAPADYAAVTNQTVTFAPGDTQRPLFVTVNGDNANESDETVEVTLSSPVAAALGDAAAVATIIDDDDGGGGGPTPAASIDDATTAEGNTGTTTNATFTVTLDTSPATTVAIDYATTDGTATEGSDYSGRAGTIVFGISETTRTITVPIRGDGDDEPNETYSVLLSSPQNATLADATGTGTITDDDLPSTLPTLSVDDVTQPIAESATATATFTVRLSAPSTQQVGVDYSTASGTATEGQDFSSRFGRLVFGVGATTRTVSVPLLGDSLDEDDEQFTLTLSGAEGATIADGDGRATIADQTALPRVELVPGQSTVLNETDVDRVVEVGLRLVPVSGRTVTATLVAEPGPGGPGLAQAAVPEDVSLQGSPTVTFPAGTTDGTATVVLKGDVAAEPSEQFRLVIGSAANATTGAPLALTIADDDTAPTVSVAVDSANASVVFPGGEPGVVEGGTVGASVPFRLTLTNPPKIPVAVHVRAVPSGAHPATLGTVAATGIDARDLSADVTFAAGEQTKMVSVPIFSDTVYEDYEGIGLRIDSATVEITTGRAGAVIIDNDPAPLAQFAADRFTRTGNAATVQLLMSARAERDFVIALEHTQFSNGGNAVLEFVTIPAGADTVTFLAHVPGASVNQQVVAPVDQRWYLGDQFTAGEASRTCAPGSRCSTLLAADTATTQHATAPPVIPASARVPESVTCPPGTFTPALTSSQTVTTTWLDTASGAVVSQSATFTLPASLANRKIACFTVVDGAAFSGRSNEMSVQPPLLLIPAIETATVAPTSNGGAITTMDVSCPAGSGSCVGTATLELAPSPRGTVARAAAVKVLAKQRFNIAAGKSKKLKLRLSKAAVKRLRKARAKGLRVTPVVTLTKPKAARIVGTPYTLKIKAKKARS